MRLGTSIRFVVDSWRCELRSQNPPPEPGPFTSERLTWHLAAKPARRNAFQVVPACDLEDIAFSLRVITDSAPEALREDLKSTAGAITWQGRSGPLMVGGVLILDGKTYTDLVNILLTRAVTTIEMDLVLDLNQDDDPPIWYLEHSSRVQVHFVTFTCTYGRGNVA